MTENITIDNKFGDIQFGPRPRLCLGFIEHPSEMLLEMDAQECLAQIQGIMWRVQKMNFVRPENSNISHENPPTDKNCGIISSDVYKAKQRTIRHAASAFLPGEPGSYGSVDVMVLSCTSMSFVLGTNIVQEEMRIGYPCVREVTDMATAVKTALTSIAKANQRNTKARPLRIIMLTPYIEEVHAKNVEFVETCNTSKDLCFKVVFSASLELPSDDYTTAVEPKWILAKVKEMALLFGEEQKKKYEGNEEYYWDVLFIGCSAMNVTGGGFIDRCEKELGDGCYGDANPFVVTSSQATMWHALHKGGTIPFDEIKHVRGYGKLFGIKHCE